MKIIYASLTAMILVVSATAVFAQKGRAAVSGAEVNGTFRSKYRAPYQKFSNEMKILALGGGKLRVAFDLVYPYKMSNGEDMVNMGTLDEEIPIVGDLATYTSKDGGCKIEIRFIKPGTVQVTQSGDSPCGFGLNVTADGTYTKISSKKPQFDSGEQ